MPYDGNNGIAFQVRRTKQAKVVKGLVKGPSCRISEFTVPGIRLQSWFKRLQPMSLGGRPEERRQEKRQEYWTPRVEAMILVLLTSSQVLPFHRVVPHGRATRRFWTFCHNFVSVPLHTGFLHLHSMEDCWQRRRGVCRYRRWVACVR